MPTFRGQIRDNQIILVAMIAVSQANDGSRKSYQALLGTGGQSAMVSDKLVRESNSSRPGTARSFRLPEIPSSPRSIV